MNKKLFYFIFLSIIFLSLIFINISSSTKKVVDDELKINKYKELLIKNKIIEKRDGDDWEKKLHDYSGKLKIKNNDMDIIDIQDNYLSVKDQKDIFNEKKRLFGIKEAEKIAKFNLKNKKNRSEYIDDFNSMADVIIKYDPRVRGDVFERLFYKEELKESEKKYILKIAGNYLNISDGLKKINIKKKDLESFNKNLIIFYKNIYVDIVSLLDKKENNKNMKNIIYNIDKLNKIYVDMNYFININDVNFKSSDSGVFFKFVF